MKLKKQHTILRSDEIDDEDDTEMYMVKTNNEIYADQRMQDLKNKVLAQRGNICEDCKVWQHRKHLQLHHLDYDKDMFSVDNVKLLCITCHKKIQQDLEFFSK